MFRCGANATRTALLDLPLPLVLVVKSADWRASSTGVMRVKLGITAVQQEVSLTVPSHAVMHLMFLAEPKCEWKGQAPYVEENRPSYEYQF